jgi:hypothetical protein
MSPACDDSPHLSERVAVLENELVHIRDEVARAIPKIDAMYNMMLEGRGATKLGRAGIWLAGTGGLGALVAAKWHALAIWIGTN